jgi:CDP-diacylglycerol--glycerol-3-phosphate 3-phosphatidyltransferase
MNEWEIDNLPNRLTLMRVLLVPVIIGCLYTHLLPWPWLDGMRSIMGWIATWVFVVASITDFFDGFIARKRNIVTVFGSFLDPVADKFLVVSSLLMLQGLGRIPVIIVVILVLREFYITSLRLLAGEKGISVPVGQMGKWKTTMQMIGIPMLMAYESPWGIPLPTIGIFCIYGASVFSLYSAMDYSWSLFRKLNSMRKEKRSKKLAQKANAQASVKDQT